ncbi:MAG: hypothetical protein HY716_03940 [Planctomycetes bacterium]|nr:hypothetical protein [Planctomycetota bacterium]
MKVQSIVHSPQSTVRTAAKTKSSVSAPDSGLWTQDPGLIGVTLLELLAVIVILSLVLSMSVFLLREANRDLGVRAATGHIVTLLRAVQHHVRAEGSPAWVLLDMKEQQVYTLTQQTVQMWHFEDDSGAFGMKASVHGALRVPGRVGMAYRFVRPSQTIECGAMPDIPQDGGFSIGFWFQKTGPPRRSVLCRLGRDVEISMEGSGRMNVRLGAGSLDSGRHLVPRDAWAYVHLSTNGRDAILYLNGAEVGRAAVSKAISGGGSLILGSKHDGFMGLIDEVRLSLILRRDAYRLPSECRIEVEPCGTAARDQYLIAFDPQGRLDARSHPSAVTLKIISPAEEEVVTITPEGLVHKKQSPAP